jgi:hypothetical protein
MAHIYTFLLFGIIHILELCKSTGLRICNGRFGVDSSKFTFQNKNGCSVIDYLLISSDCVYSLIKKLTVKEFNTYSCHAPLNFHLGYHQE